VKLPQIIGAGLGGTGVNVIVGSTGVNVSVGGTGAGVSVRVNGVNVDVGVIVVGVAVPIDALITGTVVAASTGSDAFVGEYVNALLGDSVKVAVDMAVGTIATLVGVDSKTCQGCHTTKINMIIKTIILIIKK
jgi:hypothetical protein